ncbi:MAG: hypothetical protein ACRBB4_08980 [Neptuniibacter sp.]
MNFLKNASLKRRLQFFPASLIAASSLLIGLLIYVILNYSSLFDHLHQEDMQVLTKISNISSEFEQTHSKLLTLFDSSSTTPEQAYPEATIHLDKIHSLINQIGKISSDGHLELELHHSDHVINTNELTNALNDYLLTSTIAMERYFYDPASSHQIIQDQVKKSAEVNHFLTALTSSIVQQIENEMRATADETIITSVLLVILGLALVVITIKANTGVAGRVDNSLSAIRKSLLGLAKGELSVHIPAKDDTPEIKEMATALNTYKQTQVALNNTLTELSEIKSDLELRVEQRTSQLQDTNQKLIQEISQNLMSQEQLNISKGTALNQ